MNCQRPECALPVTPCPDKHRTGSCWFYLCNGWVHENTLTHSCPDLGGEAKPAEVA